MAARGVVDDDATHVHSQFLQFADEPAPLSTDTAAVADVGTGPGQRRGLVRPFAPRE